MELLKRDVMCVFDALTLPELEAKSKRPFSQKIFPIKYRPRSITRYVFAEGGCLYFSHLL